MNTLTKAARNKPNSKSRKTIQALFRPVEGVTYRRVVPGFAPSAPTYAQRKNDGTGLTERDFQAVGSSWMIENPIGILGDDMGLGKCKMTLDAIMHVAKGGLCDGKHPKHLHSVLIVCEASNIDTWLDELQLWYPDQPRFAYRGSKRVSQFEEWAAQYEYPDEDYYPVFLIMSYAVYRLDHNFIAGLGAEWVILDEGQIIRGNKLNGKQSQIGEYIHELHPIRRHILSGTPIVNTIADWWNIGRWLGVEHRSWGRFEDETLVTIPIKVSRWKINKKIVDTVPAGVIQVRNMLRSVMLRRTKDNALPDLPKLRKVPRLVRMYPGEISKYEKMLAVHKDAVRKLENGDEPAILPQVARIRLEQLTSSIQSKIDTADNLVREAVGSGQKVLVFTKHLETLRMLYKKLKPYGIVYITGSVSTDAKAGEQSARGKAVHAFQEDPNVNVLIGTAQACRTGITLTKASLVILMDEEYSPKLVQQLIDRAHRIGQTNHVLVIRLEAVRQYGTKLKSTIEAQLKRMLKKKGESIDSISELSRFSNREIVTALEDEDIV